MSISDDLIDSIINRKDRQIIFPIAHKLYGNSNIINRLCIIYRNENLDDLQQKLIIESIAQIDLEAGARALESLYSDTVPRLQKHIIRLLGHCSQISSISLLGDILNNDSSDENKSDAISALTNIHSPLSLEVLQKARQKENLESKYNLIESGIRALEISLSV